MLKVELEQAHDELQANYAKALDKIGNLERELRIAKEQNIKHEEEKKYLSQALDAKRVEVSNLKASKDDAISQAKDKADAVFKATIENLEKKLKDKDEQEKKLLQTVQADQRKLIGIITTCKDAFNATLKSLQGTTDLGIMSFDNIMAQINRIN